MIYVILFESYNIAYLNMLLDLTIYGKFLNIRKVDRRRRLVVQLMNRDEVHYVPEDRFELWTTGRRNWTVIKSLGELVGRKSE